MKQFRIAAALALAAFAFQGPLVLAQEDAAPAWAFEESDLPLDPGFVFGRLDNGMRYIIRHNATPAGQGMVRMHIDAGSLSESDAELGYAHFVEHMAFNGSTNVPEGEMVKLLEREGLAFGADTNASTGFDVTLYMLDLPRNDPALLGTALMLMRETASELSFAPEAVERERGVVLSEKRVRDTFAYRNAVEGLIFGYPGSRLARRVPIGEVETLNAADSAALKDLWDRLYTPLNTTLIVVGDFDPEQVRTLIEQRFGDWETEPRHEAPSAGPIDPEAGAMQDIFVHPALPESVSISRNATWREEPDTVEQRRIDVLRQIGYGIVNRRFQSLTRQQDSPLRMAQLGTGGVYRAGRTTTLTVVTGNGEWKAGTDAAAAEYRRVLAFGLSAAEVAEQVANLRSALENAVAGAATRDNGAFVQAALGLLNNERVPTTPETGLERFEAMQGSITPEAVLAALRDDLIPLDQPLIRFSGPAAPEGGEQALAAAWDEAMAAQLENTLAGASAEFAYTDFGAAGSVVSDAVEPVLGIRTIRFANGVRLNLRQTDLQDDRVLVQLNLDGGAMLNTGDNPLAMALASGLPIGGLGKHSQDELQSILAGRTVSMGFQPDERSFRSSAVTTPRDLELQLQLLAALITDPGYRTEGEIQFRRNIDNFFDRLNATPALALGNNRDGILSDRDPRFTLQPREDYLALDFARLKTDISDRLAHGAIELALVGDFDPDTAIATVARTLGALPVREADFRSYEDNRQRGFTSDRSQRVLHHDGEPEQSMIEMIWPTRDDADMVESAQLGLLQRAMGVILLDRLREDLGKTYGPGVSASQSRTYHGYGLFRIQSEVDAGDIDATRQAILDTLGELAAAPVDADVLQRARQPLLEAIDNALKTNNGWMNLVALAQGEPDRIGRYSTAKEVVSAITGEDLQALVQRYLKPDERVEIVVLARPREAPAGEE